MQFKEPDLFVVWYTAPADGPALHPGAYCHDRREIAAAKRRLERKYRGTGGCITRVYEYDERQPK